MSDAFPTMVYRTPGPHAGPPGTTYEYLGIDDAAQLKAALAKGWHASLAEAATAKPAKEVIETAEAMEAAVATIDDATRESLEVQARALGVSFNARTKDEVLVRRIAEAQS